jgi:hypothetical protein
MKKFMRILGILGGIAAVAWAMRDRFVSIAAPREPEPPSFRVVTEPRAGGRRAVFARRLMEAGIATISQLAAADPARVAEVAGVPAARVETWLEQAAALAAQI